jgi:NADH-quinone oxidoreductase subunit J
MISDVLIAVFGAMAIVFALLVVVLRQPMRAALALVAHMVSLAAIFACLEVHVVALFQILIYVGAVMVFMVYAIMLLDVRDRSFTRRFSWLLVPGVVVAVAFLAVLAHGVWQVLPEPAASTAGARFGIQTFSLEFLNEYWLHFELVSVLLVAAVVAALAVLEVGRRDRG